MESDRLGSPCDADAFNFSNAGFCSMLKSRDSNYAFEDVSDSFPDSASVRPLIQPKVRQTIIF